MKNLNELKEFVPYKLNEIDSLKEYLDGMALKGWKLKAIKMLYHFDKIEPQKLYYTVDVIKKPDLHDIDQNGNASTIIQNHLQTGWDYVCKTEEFVVFVTDKDDIKPIEIEELSKFKNIKRSILKTNPFWRGLFLSILLILNFDFIMFTTYYFDLIYSLSILSIIIVDFLYITYFNIWCFKQKKKLIRGEKVRYISKIGIKNKKILFKIKVSYIIIITLALVISLIIEMSPNDQKDNIIYSSSTFLASSTTYKLVLFDKSEVWVDVFKSKHSIIINGYLNSKGKLYSTKVKTSNIYVPEWEALYTFNSGDEYIIVYNDCIISFFSSEPLDEKDIKQIKLLKN